MDLRHTTFHRKHSIAGHIYLFSSKIMIIKTLITLAAVPQASYTSTKPCLNSMAHSTGLRHTCSHRNHSFRSSNTCGLNLADGLLDILGEQGPARSLGRAESTRERELGVKAIDAVGGVDVLDQRDLVTGGASLTGGDGGVGKEELPDLLPR